jgi:hypothetical protein
MGTSNEVNVVTFWSRVLEEVTFSEILKNFQVFLHCFIRPHHGFLP